MGAAESRVLHGDRTRCHATTGVPSSTFRRPPLRLQVVSTFFFRIDRAGSGGVEDRDALDGGLGNWKQGLRRKVLLYAEVILRTKALS